MIHWARVKLHVGERKARAISAALRPSNVRLPKGMGISVRARGDKLLIGIRMQDGLYTLLSTLNEMLGEVEAACSALAVSEKGDGSLLAGPSFK